MNKMRVRVGSRFSSNSTRVLEVFKGSELLELLKIFELLEIFNFFKIFELLDY